MVVYSFYIFDRHAECIYKKKWPNRPTSTGSRSQQANGLPDGPSQQKALSAEDDAKLVFGTIFSLRNMVRKLGGEDDRFISYRTGQYKLHYYETPTSLKFVMVTDTKTNNLRIVLHQIYVSLYVEFVVKNPLSPVEHPRGIGVNCEMFELGVEQFVVRLFGAGFSIQENLTMFCAECVLDELGITAGGYSPLTLSCIGAKSFHFVTAHTSKQRRRGTGISCPCSLWPVAS